MSPLAVAVGSSHRNIAYRFGSQENLLCLIRDAVREWFYEEFRALQEDTSSLNEAMNRHWDWLAAPAHQHMERLLYEIFGISANNTAHFSNYAWKLAEQGFVTIAFDRFCQGESSGEPRQLEKPYVGTEAYRDGTEIYGRATASKDRQIVWLESSSHYDLYNKSEAVGPTLEKLVPFFRTHLGNSASV